MEGFLTIAGSLIVAIATAFFASRFYVHQATADLRNEYQKRFNEKKWETYTSFAATVRDVAMSKDPKHKGVQHSHTARLQEFASQLWLVGSDDVVKAVVQWRRSAIHASEHGKPIRHPLLDLADILIAMRKDLGNTDSRISPRDLLLTFINDVDRVLEEKNEETPNQAL